MTQATFCLIAAPQSTSSPAFFPRISPSFYGNIYEGSFSVFIYPLSSVLGRKVSNARRLLPTPSCELFATPLLLHSTLLRLPEYTMLTYLYITFACGSPLHVRSVSWQGSSPLCLHVCTWAVRGGECACVTPCIRRICVACTHMRIMFAGLCITIPLAVASARFHC
jgi:hypothetical protein